MNNDRKSVILSVIRANPYGNQLALSREVKARTGAGVSFPHLKRLRDAVGRGTYDTVFGEIFGASPGQVAKRKPGRPPKDSIAGPATAISQVASKRGPGRPPKSASAPIVESAPIVQTALKRGPGRPRKDGTPAQPREPKQRGDRRAKYDLRGRRGADKNKVQLDEFSDHLVVCRTPDGLEQQAFKSRERAQERVRELLAQGLAATDIAYYRLNPIKTTVTVVID